VLNGSIHRNAHIKRIPLKKIGVCIYISIIMGRERLMMNGILIV